MRVYRRVSHDAWPAMPYESVLRHSRGDAYRRLLGLPDASTASLADDAHAALGGMNYAPFTASRPLTRVMAKRHRFTGASLKRPSSNGQPMVSIAAAGRTRRHEQAI